MVWLGGTVPPETSKVTKFETTGPLLNVNVSVNPIGLLPLTLNTDSAWVLVTELPLEKLKAGKADGETPMVVFPPALMLMVTWTVCGLFVTLGPVMVRVPV